MRRVVILFAGLAAIMLVFAAYVGLPHSVRAWFSEPFQEPTQAAQEATLTAKHVEIALPAELALGDVQSMVALPYIDDFEGPWPGPWQETGDLLWDRVDCNFHSPTHSASASGDPTCATYYDYQFSWLVYGPFDLSGASAGGVGFRFDLDTESGFDGLVAMVSTDGNAFCGSGLSGYSAGWMNSYPGFAPYDFADPDCPVLGQPQVWFAYLFESDETITYTGAWVDDVCIWRDDPSVCLNGGDEADLKVLDQYIYPPPDTNGDTIPDLNVSESYEVWVDKIVHNNGPLPLVEAVLDWWVEVPPGCTFEPLVPSPQQFPLDVSITGGTMEDGYIHCAEPGIHTFWWNNCIYPKDPGITDPDHNNNCRSTPLEVDFHGEGADVKVLDFWTDPPELWVDVSQWVVVNAGEIKHNNGPSSATAAAEWGIVNPPQVNVRWLAQPGDECTLDGAPVPCDSPGDINDLHFEVPLPVSETVPVWRDFELHCKEEGDFVLYLWNEEWPIDLPDPNPDNNYLETQLVVHCGHVEPAIVRIGSGSAPTCSEDTVSLTILGPPRPVGAATVDIVYNPAVAEPTDWVGGAAYDTVLCSLNPAPNTVTCTGISAMGVPGDSLLADITFHCIGETGECTPLDVQVVTLADPAGSPLPWVDEDGEFCCSGCGDVNCDGQIDAVDALFVLQYVVGMRDGSDQCPPPIGTLYLPAANVNCDSIVDAVDALFILQHVVGMRPDLCVCPGAQVAG